jgi:peptide/nickel transport system substrate-binding protein
VLVRQAIASAIDRDAIGNNLLEGTCGPAYQQFTHLGSSPSVKNPFPYSVANAKQLLAQAGYPNGITLNLIHSTVAPVPQIPVALQAMLAKAGITLKITTPANSLQTVTDFTGGKEDISIGTTGGQPHPYSWLVRYILPNGTLFKLATGPAGDELQTLATAVLNPTLKDATLQQAYDKLNTHLLTNEWNIPICTPNSYWAFPTNLKGASSMSWAWSGTYWDPRYLYIPGK